MPKAFFIDILLILYKNEIYIIIYMINKLSNFDSIILNGRQSKFKN